MEKDDPSRFALVEAAASWKRKKWVLNIVINIKTKITNIVIYIKT